MEKHKTNTVWKVSKYGIFSGPCFAVFGLDTGKYGPEKTTYLDTFHAVKWLINITYFLPILRAHTITSSSRYALVSKYRNSEIVYSFGV